ncbi:MAG: glycoside hydrolase [Deltaproteobacteria bacterium]|nr:MAG: glycoside hydrolase [Deltaproteobacteria bacterium]
MSKPKAKKAGRKKESAGKKRVVLSLKAEPGSKVFVAGTFNGWDTTKKQLKDRTGKGDYQATLLLPPGEYEYKFLVNGDWHVDPENPHWVTNEFGTLNNILRI